MFHHLSFGSMPSKVKPSVSAAQSRNGTLFEVAKVDGDESYKALMSHIQQDIKGDR